MGRLQLYQMCLPGFEIDKYFFLEINLKIMPDLLIKITNQLLSFIDFIQNHSQSDTFLH